MITVALHITIILIIAHLSTLKLTADTGFAEQAEQDLKEEIKMMSKSEESQSAIGSNSNYSNSKVCAPSSGTEEDKMGLGWLPAMRELVRQLKAHSTNHLVQIGIVRYEYFSRPILLCRSIMSFLYDVGDEREFDYYDPNNPDDDGYEDPKFLIAAKERQEVHRRYKQATKEVCDIYFKPSETATAATAATAITSKGKSKTKSKSKSKGKNRNWKKRSRSRRQLRLKAQVSAAELLPRSYLGSRPEVPASTSSGLVFQPKIVFQSVQKRLRDFRTIYQHKSLSGVAHLGPLTATAATTTPTRGGESGETGGLGDDNHALHGHGKQIKSWLQVLEQVDDELNPFGYSLIGPQYNLFYSRSGLLDEWDIMKRYNKLNQKYSKAHRGKELLKDIKDRPKKEKLQH